MSHPIRSVSKEFDYIKCRDTSCDILMKALTVAVLIIGCVAASGHLSSLATGISVVAMGSIALIYDLTLGRKVYNDKASRTTFLIDNAATLVLIILASLTLAGVVPAEILGYVIVATAVSLIASLILSVCLFDPGNTAAQRIKIQGEL